MKRKMCSAPLLANGQENGTTFRRVRCPACLRLFLLCRKCDRGHVYCAYSCRSRLRKASIDRAKKRERASEFGRQNHRDHARAYRCRLRERVGDHGSAKLAIAVKVVGGDVSRATAGVALATAPQEACEIRTNPIPTNSTSAYAEPDSGSQGFVLRCAYCQGRVRWESRIRWRSKLGRREGPPSGAPS